jgi:GTP cyclohydrolase II
MPKALQWLFPKVITKKNESSDFPSLEIDEAELNILWLLGGEKPMSIYGLSKAHYDLPVHLPESVWCLNSKEWEKRTRKKITYHYSFIHKTVDKLERKGLICTTKRASADKVKRTAKLTFQGLILYLQHSDNGNRFDHAIEHYPCFIPFAQQWDSMMRELDKERMVKALEQTLENFHVQKVKFLLRPLKMEFIGFLESPKVLFIYTERENHMYVRDEDVAEYLKNKTARILRNAYIAYLAVNDIKKMSWESKEELEKLLTKLESEKELAYFERRQVGSNPLFKGGRIKEFLPRYSGIEYFFTGMFVENLLWNERAIQKKTDEKPPDFEIEYLL